MPTKKTLKEEIWGKKSLRNSWRRLWLTRIYKMHSRNFKIPKIKNMRRQRNKLMNSEELQQTPK
jgi:hypothetical protein